MSSPTTVDPMQKLAEELEWLKQNPAFDERPATLEEFVGPDYLNCASKIRPRILSELSTIMGSKVSGERPTAYPLAMITGGIGIGKTTVASIVLPYLAHWTLCLRNPQDFFGLLDGSRIAFMQMSTSEKQALEVVFGDIKARIKYSPWFRKYPFDPTYKNQLRFEKEIWIIPGDSADTTFEGYNILGGILDEADSHKVTPNKDYAQQGFDTIENRISSRFDDRGFLLVIGQMKSAQGFAARKFEELSKRTDAHVARLAIWESRGDDYYEKDSKGNVKKFCYDLHRKKIVPDEVATLLGRDAFLRIPEVYRRPFTTNPEKALKDLAGIPPAVSDPFISLVDKIFSARDRWVQNHPGQESPVDKDGRWRVSFTAPDSLKRACHIDLAYSGDGDALGFAMGHVRELVKIDDEWKPYIVIDVLLRIKARPGGEIFLGDVRQIVYWLRDKKKFNLKTVTMDGFESTDSMQQFKKRRFKAEYVSMDRQMLPYYDLREAIYEERIEFPPYITSISTDAGNEEIEILPQELMLLVDNGRKIDHPMNGSKDVADAVAGVTFTLMGDRRFRQSQLNMEATKLRDDRSQSPLGQISHPAFQGDPGIHAPLPPQTTWR